MCNVYIDNNTVRIIYAAGSGTCGYHRSNVKKRVLLESDASGVNKRKLIQKALENPSNCEIQVRNIRHHISIYFYVNLMVYFYFKHVQCMTNFLGQTCWTQAVLEELVRLVSTDRKPYKLEILGQESELERFETSQNSQTAAYLTCRLDAGLLKLKWDLLSGTVVLCVFASS